MMDESSCGAEMMSAGREGPLWGVGGFACLEVVPRSPFNGSPCLCHVIYEKMSIRSY